MPALAVVGPDHQIVRSTETFRRRCDDAAALCGRAPELDLVLTGQTDTAVVDLGDFCVAIEAVTDSAGTRQAMLSLPSDDLATDVEAMLAALREAAGDSQAIVWAKDLEGRYLYVNARFEQYLETSEERLRGNTDAELPPVETVDGPRLRYIEDDLKEPLQLEYTVPAYESRPPMAAFRFPLLNEDGQPIATCGVAAPSSESHVANDEAVRLMELERWNRLDPVDVRAEVLEQWRVQATPGPPPTAEPEDSAVETVETVETPEPPAPTEPPTEVPASENDYEEATPEAEAEPSSSDDGHYHREEEWVRQLRQAAQINAADAVSDTADALQSDLQLARKWAERADQLQGDLQEAHARLREAEADAQQSSAAAQLATEEAKRYQAEFEQAREESLRYKGEQERARGQLDEARGELDEVRGKLEEAHGELDEVRGKLEEARGELDEARRQLGEAREELEREQAEAEAARSQFEGARRELEVARRELGAARAQSESLRGPSDAALRLSEELGRALAAERERGDELARVLARVRSRLGDFEGALDRTKPARRATEGPEAGA